MKREEIIEKLVSIFENDLRLKPNENFFENMDKSIFLAPYGLQVPQLLLFFDEIEKQFDIRFDETDVINGAFMSMDSIVNTIKSYTI